MKAKREDGSDACQADESSAVVENVMVESKPFVLVGAGDQYEIRS